MGETSGRERVVRKYDPRGVLCAAFLWGALLGSFIQQAGDWLGEWLGPAYAVALAVIMIHVVVLWYAAVPLMLARVTGRKRWFVLAAVLMNLGMFVSSFVVVLATLPGFGGDPGTPLVNPAQPVAFAITSLISVAAAMAVRWAYRLLVAVPVEDEGMHRCAVCAYEMGAADPCPECGTLRAEAKPRGAHLDAAWRLVQKLSRPALIIAMIACGVYAGVRIQRDLLPTRRFVERFGGEKNASYAYIDVLDEVAPGQVRYHNSIGMTIDLKDGTGRLILVSFNASAAGHLPVMQVRICAAATPPAGWPAGAQRMTDWGLPNTVVADLDREQADRVTREGLPRGLVEAIVAKADEIGWKAGGGMQNVGGARLEIDTGRYFSDERSAAREAAGRGPR